MSGRDERKLVDIPVCPKCGERPVFWVIKGTDRVFMCQLFSKAYSLVTLRSLSLSGSTVSFYRGYNSMDDVDRGFPKYAWCKACATNHEDASFVRVVVEAAKQLEKIRYVDNE